MKQIFEVICIDVDTQAGYIEALLRKYCKPNQFTAKGAIDRIIVKQIKRLGEISYRLVDNAIFNSDIAAELLAVNSEGKEIKIMTLYKDGRFKRCDHDIPFNKDAFSENK